ncbi:cytochrome P450 [Cyathus striatus]|nr:cytochrome P450 [Cyathus striatus]
MDSSVNIWDIAAVGGTLAIIGYLYNSRRNALPLPPGPKKLPLIGNILDIPSTSPWKKYAEWAKLYESDVLHLEAAGSSIVVLNSYEAAKELLEKRSAIYSSRPHSVMLSELSGFGWQLGLMPYNDDWRARRTLFQRHLHPNNKEIYQPRAKKYVRRMLRQLLKDPEDYVSHVDHMAVSISLGITYGIKIRSSNDPYVEIAVRVNTALIKSLGTGARMVDVFPLLKYVPEWFPGADFQRVARSCRDDVADLRKIFAESQRLIDEGSAQTSVLSKCLDKLGDNTDANYLNVVKDVAPQIFMAATDTTASAVQMFILAMLCNPEAQERAQQELDSVLDGRLPEYSDKDSLPYLSAVIKETIRWEPTVPTAVAHVSTEDDVYNGMYIPKNSIIIPNAWAMLRNEQDYPESEQFKPERWLNANGQLNTEIRDSEDIIFGFGRRVCPGKHVGYDVMWLAAASVLATFTISKARDANGNEIEPSRELVAAAVVHPAPFPCSFKPRSKHAVDLIHMTAHEGEEGY